MCYSKVQVGIKKLEDRFNDAFVDTVVAHCEDNQECAPLLPEQQQELRNRIRSKVQEPGSEQKSEPEGSNNESSGAQKPEESFGEWVLRLFREMLNRQKKIWKDVLASIFASFVKVAKTIWSVIESFFSSVAKCFSSLCQA
ncbi:interleukin-32 isoform X1 [Pipistrellus kuhlii]|uniref:interleukin-32 isoform X1 n=1 Tax=Pipistrellus kuhlii TaxID=59472 RepID=UPI001E26ED1B|nr:interleukin-32 isoform X1 [Pipistrellus kuhlii]